MNANSGRLKLRGAGTADIVTISGLVQDALIAPAEMTVETDKRRFVAILNRFMWERTPPPPPPPAPQSERPLPAPKNTEETGEDSLDARFEDADDGRFWRVQSALVIERANTVRRKGMEPQPNASAIDGKAYHYLLSIVPEDDAVTLYFAGGGMIRAIGPALQVFLEDLSEPWPTPQMPVHQESHDEAG